MSLQCPFKQCPLQQSTLSTHCSFDCKHCPLTHTPSRGLISLHECGGQHFLCPAPSQYFPTPKHIPFSAETSPETSEQQHFEIIIHSPIFSTITITITTTTTIIITISITIAQTLIPTTNNQSHSQHYQFHDRSTRTTPTPSSSST